MIEIKDRRYLKKRLNYLKFRNPSYFKNLDLEHKTDCPFCGQSVKIGFRDMSATGRTNCDHEFMMSPHYVRHHLELMISELEAIENNKPEDKKGYDCPICGENWVNLKSHVERDHHLTWNVFVDEYNFKGNEIKFTESHRAALSQNKKKFYNSENGKIWKKTQGKRVKGVLNPACRSDVRQKISKACIGRKVSNHLKEVNSEILSKKLRDINFYKTRGYSFKFIYNNELYNARSIEEFQIMISLLENNIPFKYEPCRMKYFLEYNRTYTPDFLINNVYYETKSTENEFNDEKYDICKRNFKEIGSELKLLTTSNFEKEFGVMVLSKQLLFDKIRSLLFSGYLEIEKPSNPKYKNYNFLLKIFGEDYNNIIEQYKEQFRENKERLCRSK